MTKHLKRLCLFLLAILLTQSFALERASAAAALNAQEQTLLALMNEDRARYGLSALTVDPALCEVARIKAEDMLSNGYFAHASPTYGNIRQMLTAFGISYRGASENIARSRSVYHAEAAFLSSSTGHRQTLLGSQWTRVGVGVAVTRAGFVYVSQVFAR